MEQIKTKRKITKEEFEKMMKEIARERARRIAELEAPELTQEEKEILIGIKMGLEDYEQGRYCTHEELMEILFGKDGLCT